MKNTSKALSLCALALCIVCVMISFASCKRGDDSSYQKNTTSDVSGKGDSWSSVKTAAGEVLSIVPGLNKTVAYWETDFGKNKDSVILYFTADMSEFKEYVNTLINDGWEINNDSAGEDGIYRRQSNYYADFIKGDREIHISYSDGGHLTELDSSYSMSVEVTYKY